MSIRKLDNFTVRQDAVQINMLRDVVQAKLERPWVVLWFDSVLGHSDARSLFTHTYMYIHKRSLCVCVCVCAYFCMCVYECV